MRQIYWLALSNGDGTYIFSRVSSPQFSKDTTDSTRGDSLFISPQGRAESRLAIEATF